MNVAVLIPAYNPGIALVHLIRELINDGVQDIVVVDDGSAGECAGIFSQLHEFPQCTVLSHATNLGKGQALKTGFRYILQKGQELIGVVTADADGQHLTRDIVRLTGALAQRPDHLVLGVRTFRGAVPLRSAFGNHLTRLVFATLVGRNLADTQTGLRAIPTAVLPKLLTVSGDRYEYEMNVLIASKTLRLPLHEEPIETVYLDGNKSSHFRPLWDSMAIYAVFFRFVLSSLVASALDFALFAFALTFGLEVMESLLISRSISSLFYLFLKKDFVFQSKRAASALLLR
jgi:glycosyltransferase involved in cell wall biosynthesis